MHVRRAATLLVLAAAAAACGAPAATPAPAPAGPSSYFGEEPVGSKKWTPLAGEPAWVKNPPPRDGYLRVVGESASDLRDIATTKALPYDAHDRRVREPLTPIVGEDAAKLASKVANKNAKLLARATREEDGPNPRLIGSHFVQAWALWEVAIDDVVADLPADKRDAARAALAASK
jgi:hypothetical protein